ncbi:hypothetical protein AB0C47_19610 [Micromonospora taraxaci]|uniref:hypothetical protein n=1 Tax=Micromonospora taraxaci TaxID=1316803 RepID=UPI0033F924D0
MPGAFVQCQGCSGTWLHVILRPVGGSGDEAWSAYLERSRDLAEQILRVDDPYDLGLQFMGRMLDLTDIGEYAVSMYCLWGALTDRVELKPDEEDRALAEMARAAREWLAVDHGDSDAIRRYFDYWLYDVCGYERPEAQSADASDD